MSLMKSNSTKEGTSLPGHQWSFEPVEIEVERPAISLEMAAAAGAGTVGTFAGGPVFGVIGAAAGALIAHAFMRHHYHTHEIHPSHQNGSRSSNS